LPHSFLENSFAKFSNIDYHLINKLYNMFNMISFKSIVR